MPYKIKAEECPMFNNLYQPKIKPIELVEETPCWPRTKFIGGAEIILGLRRLFKEGKMKTNK